MIYGTKMVQNYNFILEKTTIDDEGGDNTCTKIVSFYNRQHSSSIYWCLGFSNDAGGFTYQNCMTIMMR